MYVNLGIKHVETRNIAVVLICIILFSSIANAYGSFGNEFYFVSAQASSSNEYVINLIDGVKSTSTKYESDQKNSGKNYVVNLLDGVTARYGHEKPTDNYVNGIPVERKFISVKLVDGVNTRSTDFNNDDVVIINNFNQKQATRDRIFPHERIKNTKTLFQSIQEDEIPSQEAELLKNEHKNSENELPTLVSTASEIFDDVLYGDSSESQPVYDLFVDGYPEYSLQLPGKPIQIVLSDIGHAVVNTEQPTFLILLIPLVGIVFLRGEKEKIRLLH